jgi:hypothetical protein
MSDKNIIDDEILLNIEDTDIEHDELINIRK